ncbi:hypothetical protein PSTT_04414 [Puccinia striiformis]|uniref:Uncharacterized protein n=1 Tax=Puccinia striiformis TaxID=27350 RepID=A0A2S4VTB4_9BASI|nr:hypothetical protein PSTT_04414 [Puccinia striiformis]
MMIQDDTFIADHLEQKNDNADQHQHDTVLKGGTFNYPVDPGEAKMNNNEEVFKVRLQQPIRSTNYSNWIWVHCQAKSVD